MTGMAHQVFNDTVPLISRCIRRLGNLQAAAGAVCLSTSRRLHSTRTEAEKALRDSRETFLEVPGGKLPYTSKLQFHGGPNNPIPSIPVYRTIDSAGEDVPGAEVPYPLSQDLALRMYTCMARLQTMDTLFYEAQRQGRFSFYLTCQGEEATNVGSAAGLDDADMVFAQYREQGVLLWRGYTLRQFANQLMGNCEEPGKGRQMPIHYGSPAHAYQTISSPLATQLPHAVGAAYAMRMSGAARVSAAYFGDGASSEGDAHAAFNFAAVLGAPCLFICRNNGYAISTPAHEQYQGDGIASRGPVYGMPSVRVDGGDVRAVYCAVRAAREAALAGPGPVLLEAMSYRSGHHSTSDDSTRYRTSEELRAWRARDPVARLRAWLAHPARGWWDEAREAALRREARGEVMEALEAAAKLPKPPLRELFADVYAGPGLPPHLAAQRAELMAAVGRNPGLCPADVPAE